MLAQMEVEEYRKSRESAINADEQRRDVWLRDMRTFRAGGHVYVGEGVTLADVTRWLDRAVKGGV